MIDFETYIKNRVHYERRDKTVYVPELYRRTLEGTREDLNEYFDEVEKYFEEHEETRGYTPYYIMETDFETQNWEDTWYSEMQVCYDRPETDLEMKSRIKSEEDCAIRTYEYNEECEKRKAESERLIEKQERELYEKLKKKYG